jgi:uncharacterized membrane protein
MTTFTVWKFEDPNGADKAAEILKKAQADGLVAIMDHAVVSWPVGAEHPTTKQAHEETWRGTGWGAFWGLMLGSLFFIPVVGAAAGAAIGAVTKAHEGVGIGKDEIEKMRAEITEGTSALFAVTERGDLDRLLERFSGVRTKLIATNLTPAERSLLGTFGR